MSGYDQMENLLVQHAILKIMTSEIIPCFCGEFRKVVQKKDSLSTECPKCGSQDPFNIVDLAFLGGGLLKLAIDKTCTPEFTAPDVTYGQVCQIVQDMEDWLKDVYREMLRMQLKVLKGGLSE